LLFPNRPGAWPVLACLHLVAAAMAFGASPAARAWEWLATRWPRATQTFGDWYPLVFIPALYAELAVLNHAVSGGAYFDALIIRWEQAVFRGQPSQTFAGAAPYRWLSEPLHAAYLSYYAIVFVPPLLIYLRRQRAQFQEAVFTVMLAFFAHYLFFVYFPVQGPRYLFPPPGGALADGFAYRLAHLVLESGSSQGSAFPSSHVGVAVAQTAVLLRFLPGLAPVLGVLTVGLGAGAVYGGFHYAIDAAAGLALGTGCALVAPALFRALRRTPDRSDDPTFSTAG